MAKRPRGCVLIGMVAALAGLPPGCARRLDVGAVRAALAPDSRAPFDLVVALQGLDRTGDPDWGRADQICRGLRWPRCDRPALEEMQRRSRLPRAARKDAVAAAALAVADLTWAFGSEDAARKMFRAELDRIPDADGPGRARVFLRFGIIDTNFDGQAALFNQACVADAALCDHMKDAAEREVKARFVAPGNVLPLYFTGGHPRLAGPR
jgi:hypothetical protein